MEVQRISVPIGDAEFSFETGRMARQANAAVLARLGDTVVAMAEVVATSPATESITCRTECRNQRGELVVEGSAELVSVLPPRGEGESWHR